ncbi:MAG: class I SAM-dependent methyltransferase [Planctomycetes bacterium]|nr:class I SAM-dependent methyltransferase [Planctomycetota bacterium]
MNRYRRFSLIYVLLLFSAFLCSFAGTPPARAQEEALPGFDALNLRFHQAYAQGEYAEALKTVERINDLVEEKHIHALYNIACMHCKLGDKRKAYEWLDRAVGAGFFDVAQLMKDEDFKDLRGEDRFKKITRAAWAGGYIAMLERDERAEFQKPDQVMEALALKPGEKVADIGAGSGYFTVPVAKAVGPGGRVWALDISQEMLDYLENRLLVEELENVELKKVLKDDPLLPAGACNTILMIDTIHYVQNRAAYAKKLRDGLAPGGRLVIIDYIPKSMEERPWGPHPDQQISRETLDAEMAAAGLKPVKVHDFLTEQYFVEYAPE